MMLMTKEQLEEVERFLTFMEGIAADVKAGRRLPCLNRAEIEFCERELRKNLYDRWDKKEITTEEYQIKGRFIDTWIAKRYENLKAALQ